MEKNLKLDDIEFANFGRELKDKNETNQRGYLKALLSPHKKDRLKKWKKSKKPTDQERFKVINEVAQTLNIKLP